MKTLDEIKKALSQCYIEDADDCGECPYFPDAMRGSCLTYLHRDAALMMTDLTERNWALNTELKVNRRPDTTPAADADQQAKADAGKPRLTLVPPRIIWDIAAVRQYGVEVKYPETGVDGWRTIGLERIRDAAARHFMRYLADPSGIDEESGLPHLWHLATNISFLCELEHYEGMDGLW